MNYIGIHSQQVKNNTKTITLLVLFPIITLVMVFLAILAVGYLVTISSEYAVEQAVLWEWVWKSFEQAIPWTLGIIALWFLTAYFANTFLIAKATGAAPLERKENMRVYNLVENLCMSKGMQMPKINVIRDSSLNAFASGINTKSYTVTLTTGIIDKLNDAELEGVIAHELTHIRNHDVRLLIVSIVFVGIFSLISQMAVNLLRYSSFSRSKNDKKGGIIVILLVIVLIAAIGLLITSLMKFVISRQREYMADAGSAEMTKNPLALASALKKIAVDPEIEAVKQNDVAQLFIEHPLAKKTNIFSSLFATHPPIQKRIEILEQF
ncbi:MAG: M48 family metallopeptidase [Bacteroidales bacterium]|jgi:heat shock protein HtpX|nr:M48 family metallopeptidase [Bacteroidales bacterium]